MQENTYAGIYQYRSCQIQDEREDPACFLNTAGLIFRSDLNSGIIIAQF
jgi:hypothetical protein